MTQRKILIVVFTIAVIWMIMQGGQNMGSGGGTSAIGAFIGGGLGMIAVALLINSRDHE